MQNTNGKKQRNAFKYGTYLILLNKSLNIDYNFLTLQGH